MLRSEICEATLLVWATWGSDTPSSFLSPKPLGWERLAAVLRAACILGSPVQLFKTLHAWAPPSRDTVLVVGWALIQVCFESDSSLQLRQSTIPAHWPSGHDSWYLLAVPRTCSPGMNWGRRHVPNAPGITQDLKWPYLCCRLKPVCPLESYP